jgi:hypothetical protein
MPKTCDEPGCNRRVFGGKKCDWHQHLRTDKKPKKIKFRSDRRAAQESEYSRKRKEFLERPENQMCRVYPWLPATQIHHIKGRYEDMLLNEDWWLPVSDEGHRKIEMNPDWARENNYTLSRLS